MELNREQIIKALEDMNMVGVSPKAIRNAIALIKELTQANEQLSESYDHLEKTKDDLLSERSRLAEKIINLEQAYECADSARRELSSECDRLTEENERFRANNLVFAQGVEKVAANYYKLGCTDTVREMAERWKERLPQLLMDCPYLDVINEEFWLEAAYELFEGIDQITKEMLEGER